MSGIHYVPSAGAHIPALAADKRAIVDALMGMAEFAEAGSAEIIEGDINPLFAMPEGQGAVAVDGVIRVVE